MFLYIITNNVDDKKYAGITNNIKRRWKEHRSELRGNRHGNPHLQSSWNKNGEDLFSFDIINKFNNLDELNKAEVEYIKDNKLLDPDFGYNMATGGTAFEHSQESKDKIGKSNEKSVISMGVKTGDVKIYNKIMDVREDGFNVKNIASCCVLREYNNKGRAFKTISHKQHVWMYLKDYDKNPKELDRRREMGKNPKARPSRYRPVIGKNIKTGEIIKYEATYHAEKDGFVNTGIRKCCLNPTVSKSYKGYVWAFQSEFEQIDIRLNNVFNNKTHKVYKD